MVRRSYRRTQIVKKATGAMERQGANTRQRIMDAAVETLREEGIAGATARDRDRGDLTKR